MENNEGNQSYHTFGLQAASTIQPVVWSLHTMQAFGNSVMIKI